MTILARTLLIGLAFGASACSDSVGGLPEGDYGASIAAGYINKARASCAAIYEPDLYSCSNVDRSAGEARRDALTAIDSYQTFQNFCSEDLGKAKCDAMFESALAASPTR
jgi:hypothetical protein